jgi:hypothetical protein
MRKSIIIILGILLMAAPALSDDTPGVNYHFPQQDATNTKSSMSYNPQTGASFTFDSGSTLNSDGSWTVPLSNEASGIVIRTEPAFDD